MKLEELYRPKIGKKLSGAITPHVQQDFVHMGSIEKDLAKLGWYMLDSGYFSTVFTNANKNFVLKITHNPDPGYDHYVNLIHSIKNKHFPIISDRKEIVVDKLKYTVYLIEKLKKLWGAEDDELASACKLIVARYPMPLDRVFLGRKNGAPKIIIDDPSFLKALQILGANKKRYRIDLHRQNLMQRADGTIVITDPYSFQNNSSYQALL